MQEHFSFPYSSGHERCIQMGTGRRNYKGSLIVHKGVAGTPIRCPGSSRLKLFFIDFMQDLNFKNWTENFTGYSLLGY